MSVHVIRVPDLGEGIAEVELVAWHVKPGDAIAEDQVLADVMTDKATVEIPSPVAGKVLALGGEVGQMLAVGSELIRIEVENAGAAPTAGDATAAAPAAVAAPPARRLAAATASRAAPTPCAPSPAPAHADRSRARPIASPAVRAPRLGARHRSERRARPPARPAASCRPTSTRTVRAPASARRRPCRRADARVPASDATQDVKIIGLRRKIAQKMQESKRRIPHFTYVEEVDVTEIEALRAQLNAKWGAQRGHLTLLPFLIRAIVLAVREFPQVNARFDDEAGVLTQHERGPRRHRHADRRRPDGAGAARCAGARPVVERRRNRAPGRRRAQRQGRRATNSPARRSPSPASAGSAASSTTPVINHPEVAIVGVNRIAERPVIRDGAIVARQMMNLSSSFDHRVVDGAVAAAFVQCVRAYLEHPATLFVE